MIFKTETGNKNGNEILIGPNIPMIESRFFWLSHTFEIGGITILDIRSRVRVRVCWSKFKSQSQTQKSRPE